MHGMNTQIQATKLVPEATLATWSFLTERQCVYCELQAGFADPSGRAV
jgi:hypothetical protein